MVLPIYLTPANFIVVLSGSTQNGDFINHTTKPSTQSSKSSLGENLYQRLLRQIIDGELTPDQQLPSERQLSEQYSVHRGLVREALKRLEAHKLIETRHGGGSRVLDFRVTGGLELLEPLTFKTDGAPNLAVVQDIIEWSEDLGITLACRASQRNSQLLAARLDQIIVEMRQTNPDDLSQLQDLSLRYWDDIADATQNLAYRLALNSFKAAYAPFQTLVLPLLKTALQNFQNYQNLADAIRSGDPEQSAQMAHRLISIDEHKLLPHSAVRRKGGS